MLLLMFLWNVNFLLKQQLTTLSKDPSHTIHDYIRYFKSICDDLALIGSPPSDKDKVFYLLGGLVWITIHLQLL